MGFIERIGALKHRVDASSAEIQGRLDETTCIPATKSLVSVFEQ